MNDIDILKGVLQKIVAVNANEKSLTVDHALGLIGAYMLKKYNAGISEWGAMEKFLRYLRAECFKGKKRSLISDYSFSECALYIHSFLSLQPFERKKGSLNSFVLKVITEIDDNGYLSFNDKTFNSYANQQMINGVPAQNYILNDVATEDSNVEDNNNPDNNMADNDVEEAAEEEDSGDNITTEAEAVANNENSNKQETPTPDNPVLLLIDDSTCQRNSCTDNNPFIQLYDELIAANPEKRSNAKFVWQWFLKQDEYEAIKMCFIDNKLPTPRGWDDKTTNLIAIYIGEFYKREYENNVTPFAQLGENTPNVNFGQYKEICEKLDIEPYRKNNQAHLHTLYVNGGLPVHFISSKLDNAQSNFFIDGLSKLLDVEDEIDISEGEEALGKVSNTSLRESYQKGVGHSIYEYIQAIMAGKTTWDDSDKESLDFRNFFKKLKEASKKAAERKKFKLFYSLWTYFQGTDLMEFSLQPQIRFNPEEEGVRHYAISLQRLANWGITNPPAQFSLRLGDNEMKFTKCINGDFISWDLTDRIDLNRLDRDLTPDDLLHSDFTIVFDRLNGESSQIRNDFNLPFKNGYLQFYTDDDPLMASWNSFKGTHSFLWSGLVFDKKRYHLLSPDTTTNINEELGWVTFSDRVAFEDRKNGKIHSFFNSKGRIYAKPSESCLHRKIIDGPYLLPNCLFDGMAECTIGGEQSHAYIVKSSNLKFDVFRVTNDEKVNSNPIVEYKSAQEYQDPLSSWRQYGSRSLDQGLYVFRLFNARYSTEVRCLVLPNNAEIEFYNKSTPFLIKFIGFTNVSSEGLPSSKIDNNIAFRISNNNNDVGFFNFTIGDGSGSVSLQTYHPKPQVHVYFHGRKISVNDTPILIAYADEIEVKYISANSSKNFRLSEEEKIYKRLFEALTATAMGKDVDLLIRKHDIQIDEKDKKSILPIRVYTQNIQNPNESNNMMLLDLEDNTITPFSSKKDLKNLEHDCLLFQSLKDVSCPDNYYAPKFLSHTGQGAKSNVKRDERQKKLTNYAKSFVSDYAYQQFEIACEHKMYFAFSDPLLGMCWDGEKKNFLDVTKTKFKKNLLCFLQGYLDYTNKNSTDLSIAGLKRLAREFLFDWKKLRKDIEGTPSQQLKELYQKIINK